jgi:tRNA-2-methylthio-N6-dimethylallyladenosine synthase
MMPELMEKKTATQRKVYVETLGCQMNQNDSELMLGLLAKEGFLAVTEPLEADLVILNTCQIRAKSENKAYSYLGYWNKLKRKKPGLKIVMAGCVAQQTKDEVFSRAPYIDIVLGTQNIHELPDLVRKAFAEPEKRNILAVDKQKSKSTYDYFDQVTPVRQSKVSAWVTVIEGCDYFCTYCVVPYTRGRQISRSPQSILDEVKSLADLGYQEITLLGQTVDAYGKDFDGKAYGLADLMEKIHETVPAIARIRFMTSHPLDLSDAIIDTIATLPRVMEYIHIPMQAGSNEVLERMRRGYTREQYFALIDKIRARIPGVAITGDFIVGFPGETEAQFMESVDAVRQVRFDASNTAAYSARKQTPAGIWENKGEGLVPDEEKERRLHYLNKVIGEYALLNNEAMQDQVVEVLVEGKSKRKQFERWRGRTRQNKLVNFESLLPFESELEGHIIPVKITQVNAWGLQGLWQN